MTQFKPGFRLSKTDIVVLIIGSIATIIFYPIMPDFSFIVLFVVLHFFLFCNVVRMSRIPELIWASSFIIMAGGSLLYGIPDLKTVFIIALTMTSTLEVLETMKPWYHGIFWEKINPKLPDWFARKHSSE